MPQDSFKCTNAHMLLQITIFKLHISCSKYTCLLLHGHVLVNVSQTLMLHTNDLKVLSYNTLRVRTQENVEIQDSTGGHPGESRGRL